MKRCFLLAICMFVSYYCLNAQTLAVKGVTVDGNVLTFVSKLESQGWKFSEYGFRENGSETMYKKTKGELLSAHKPIPMSGKLLDQEVYVLVYYTKTTQLVYNVEIMFFRNPDDGIHYFGSKLNSAKNMYNGLKQQFQKKYNAPFDAEEYETGNIIGNEVYLDIHAGRTTYITGYRAAPMGQVLLSISTTCTKIGNSKYPNHSLCVLLNYVNIENQKKNKAEINDVIQSEI